MGLAPWGLGRLRRAPSLPTLPTRGSGNSCVWGGCVEPGVTAGSRASISRRAPSALGATVGPSVPRGWAPKRGGLGGLPFAALICQCAQGVSQRVITPGAVYTGQQALRRVPWARGNKPLPFPPDRLLSSPVPVCDCIFHPALARGPPLHGGGRGARAPSGGFFFSPLLSPAFSLQQLQPEAATGMELSVLRGKRSFLARSC